jgi:hypothetical protein
VISENSYGIGEEYTNDRYLDRGFRFREDLAVRAWFTPGTRVMVAAAAGGRELIALQRSGFQAAGFECSRAMVQAGQRALAARGLAATLEWAPPCTVPAMNGRFDAAIDGDQDPAIEDAGLERTHRQRGPRMHIPSARLRARRLDSRAGPKCTLHAFSWKVN